MLAEMELPNRMKGPLERQDLDLGVSNEAADGDDSVHLYNGYQGPLREPGAGGASTVGETGEDGSSVASSWLCVSRLFGVLVLVHFL